MVDFQDLFGNQDGCACDECRSVLGAPAYFVDVMRRLNGAASSLVSPTRRQDLGLTELSCENTLTALPYIDLACEVLETAIRGDVSSGDAGADLLRGQVPRELKDTLALEGCPVTAAAKVSALPHG